LKLQKKNIPIKFPYYGMVSIGISIIFSTIILIYLGAATSSERIESRNKDHLFNQKADSIWWENGLIIICPLH